MPFLRAVLLGLCFAAMGLGARAEAIGRGNRFLLQNATGSTVRLWLYQTDHVAGAYRRQPVTLEPGQKEWFETGGKDYWLASYCFSPDEGAPWNTWEWHYFKELSGAAGSDRVGQVRGEPAFMVLDSMRAEAGAFRLVPIANP
jgi:hypothetical protein